MRQFYLKNENEEIFDLMDKDSFLSDPGGLGFTKDLSFLDFKLSRKVKSSNFSKLQINGEIILKDYQKYEELLNYIFNSNELYLHYRPEEIAEAYIKIEISNLPKGELNQAGLLTTKIEMEALSCWTREEQSQQVELPDVVITEAFPYTFPLSFAGSTAGVSAELPIAINNNGHLPCAIKIKIFGLSTYPEWSLGEQKGKLNLEIVDGQTVEIDSREDYFSVLSGTADLGSYLDYTLQNFIFAPAGESTLIFKNVNRVEVTVYEQYISV